MIIKIDEKKKTEDQIMNIKFTIFINLKNHCAIKIKKFFPKPIFTILILKYIWNILKVKQKFYFFKENNGINLKLPIKFQ
jgi:hypothetical protein